MNGIESEFWASLLAATRVRLTHKQDSDLIAPSVEPEFQLKFILRSCRLPLHLEMSLKSSSPSLQSQHQLLKRLSQLLQMRQTASLPPLVEWKLLGRLARTGYPAPSSGSIMVRDPHLSYCRTAAVSPQQCSSAVMEGEESDAKEAAS